VDQLSKDQRSGLKWACAFVVIAVLWFVLRLIQGPPWSILALGILGALVWLVVLYYLLRTVWLKQRRR